MGLKRFFAAALALLLLLGAAPALAASYHSDVRVLISIGKASSLEITPVGEFSLEEAPDLAVGTDAITVSVAGSRVSVTLGGETVTAAALTFKSGDYSGLTSYIRLVNEAYGTCTYLGNMTFYASGGRLYAINTLPIELYLYGVVPNEMSNSFPTEALMAQAVCARSYAMAKCSSRASKRYDLTDTSDDQVYHGYASKNRRAIAAVDATAGEVITYEGDIIEAFYSASNGGQTERTGNVWSEDYPYYVNADDEYDVLNASSLENTSFIPSVFNDETVAAMDRDVYSALYYGACDAAGEEVELVSTVRVTPGNAEYDEPSRCFTTADVTLMVKKADGTEGQLTVTLELSSLLYGMTENSLGAIGARTYRLRMYGAEEATALINSTVYGGFNLTMRRYGHGVGLSQRGAQERARDGQTAAEIIAFYYSGTTVATVGSWDDAPKVTSSKYSITKNFISNVAPGTLPAEFVSNIKCSGDLTVVTSTGAEKIESELTSGNFLRIAYNEGKSFLDIPIVIYGDLDNEGGVTKADADALAAYLARSASLSYACTQAADIDRDGEVTGADLVLLVKSINGDYTIKQKG